MRVGVRVRVGFRAGVGVGVRLRFRVRVRFRFRLRLTTAARGVVAHVDGRRVVQQQRRDLYTQIHTCSDATVPRTSE